MALLRTSITAGSTTGHVTDALQIHNKLNGACIDVKADFGAQGDNTTDDRAAIQAALDAVPAAGGTVYLPAGTYLISAALAPKSKTTVTGAGKAASIVKANAYGFPAFDLLTVDDVTIQDLMALCTSTRVPKPNAFRGDAERGYVAGVWMNGSRNTVRNVHVKGFGMGFSLTNWVNGGINNGVVGDNAFYNISAELIDHGFLFYGQKHLTVDGLVVRDNEDTSSGVDPTHAVYGTSVPSTDIVMSNLYNFNNPAGASYQYKQCTGVSLTNIYAYNTCGLFNLVGPLSWLKATGCVALQQKPIGQSSVICIQNAGESNCHFSDILIEMIRPRRSIQLYGTNNTIENMTLYVSRVDVGAGGLVIVQDDFDITIDGSNNTLRDVTVVGNATTLGRCIGVAGGSGHVVTDLRTRNVRTGVDIESGVTDSRVIVDRALQSVETGFTPVNNAGGSTNFIGSSTTALRATAAAAGVGQMAWDTTLGKPIWSNGTVWKDATGTTV